MNAATLARLRAEIRSDRQSIDRWLDELSQLAIPLDSDRAVLSQAAWALHHAYSGVEAILERTMRVIERSVPEGQDSHKALLDTAALDIEGIRPRLLRPDTAAALHEMRAFRHFVRHAYAVDLDPDRLRALRDHTALLRPKLTTDLDLLDRWLGDLQGELPTELASTKDGPTPGKLPDTE